MSALFQTTLLIKISHKIYPANFHANNFPQNFNKMNRVIAKAVKQDFDNYHLFNFPHQVPRI